MKKRNQVMTMQLLLVTWDAFHDLLWYSELLGSTKKSSSNNSNIYISIKYW